MDVAPGAFYILRMLRIGMGLAVVVLATAASCESARGEREEDRTATRAPGQSGGSGQGRSGKPADGDAPELAPGRAEAVFAGGCFWCMEKPFETLEGVVRVTSGYTGGELEDPSYDQVSSGSTEHAEAVRVVYDPSRIDYERLVEVFWHNIDPTQEDGQFCDHGSQYRTAIFVTNAKQRKTARRSLKRIRKQLGREIVTEIVDAGPFWLAEDYHQDYYRTHSARYQRYRQGCGRDARLRELWGEQAGH